ncbi:hypothetical protein HanRHA438_Chr08g0353841 [Helianthus annuus]|nr:hypothetical protein HanRHA438_Chr08g0353841 [Helianthus annuus]
MRYFEEPRNLLIIKLLKKYIIFEPTPFLMKLDSKCRHKYSRSNDIFTFIKHHILKVISAK